MTLTLMSLGMLGASPGCIVGPDSLVAWEVEGRVLAGNGHTPLSSAQVDIELLHEGARVGSKTRTTSDDSGRFESRVALRMDCFLLYVPFPIGLPPPEHGLGPRPDEIRLSVKAEDGRTASIAAAVTDAHVRWIHRSWFVPVYGKLALPPLEVELAADE